MNEGDPGAKRPRQPDAGDLFAGKGRVPLSEIINSFGYEPGSPEYKHIQDWIGTSMEALLGQHIHDNLLFQVDERRARALRISAEESLEMIRDAQKLTQDEVATATAQLPSTHPSLENPSKVRKPDASHPWSTPADNKQPPSKPVDLTEGEDSVVTPLEVKESYTAGELLKAAKIPTTLKDRIWLSRKAKEAGYTVTNGQFYIPPERIELFLDTINPRRHPKKTKKR